MSNHLWQRLGAASGIVYVIVILAPDLIPRDQSEEATMTAAEAMAQSCATSTAAQLTDAIYPITHILGYLFFLFFLGSLWSALRRAEGADGWLSAEVWSHSPSSSAATPQGSRLLAMLVRGSTFNSGRYCKT